MLFSSEGPKPWLTKPGGSRLDAEIAAVRERKDYSFAQALGDGEINGEEKGQHAHIEG